MKIEYVIGSMSAGWCAALSIASNPYSGEHDCGYWFLNLVLPCMYAMARTLVMDRQVPANLLIATLPRDDITNDFIIEDEAELEEEVDLDTDAILDDLIQ
jgi:hypothetical protein